MNCLVIFPDDDFSKMHPDKQRVYLNHWKGWIEILKKHSLDINVIAEHQSSIDKANDYNLDYSMVSLIPYEDSTLIFNILSKGIGSFSESYYKYRKNNAFTYLNTPALAKKKPKASKYKGNLMEYYSNLNKFIEDRLKLSYSQLYSKFDVIIQFKGNSNKIPIMDDKPSIGDGVIYILVDVKFDRILYGGVNINKDIVEKLL